jgi:hypothetical protein
MGAQAGRFLIRYLDVRVGDGRHFPELVGHVLVVTLTRLLS